MVPLPEHRRHSAAHPVVVLAELAHERVRRIAEKVESPAVPATGSAAALCYYVPMVVARQRVHPHPSHYRELVVGEVVERVVREVYVRVAAELEPSAYPACADIGRCDNAVLDARLVVHISVVLAHPRVVVQMSEQHSGLVRLRVVRESDVGPAVLCCEVYVVVPMDLCRGRRVVRPIDAVAERVPPCQVLVRIAALCADTCHPVVVCYRPRAFQVYLVYMVGLKRHGMGQLALYHLKRPGGGDIAGRCEQLVHYVEFAVSDVVYAQVEAVSWVCTCL